MIKDCSVSYMNTKLVLLHVCAAVHWYIWFFPFNCTASDHAGLRNADPHHFNADPDPDPEFHINANQDSTFFTSIRIRILPLITVMGICDS